MGKFGKGLKTVSSRTMTGGKGNLLQFKVPLDYLKKHGVKRVLIIKGIFNYKR